MPPDGGGIPMSIDDKNCGYKEVKLERLPPKIFLVFDRSSSMSRKVDSGGTLWTNTVSALDDTLKATQDTVEWGMTLFPTPSGCNVSPTVEVPMAPKNHAMIMSVANGMNYNSSGDGGTPTSDAMKKATAYLLTDKSPNPKYILLATDGQPTCPKNGAIPDAIASVRAAAAAGFRTFVVGIGLMANETATLNELAVAGQTPRNDPTYKYYPVSNKDDLVKSLSQITVAVASCTFPLDMPPPSLNMVGVYASKVKIPSSPTDGWSYGPGNKSVILNGPACDAVKNGSATNVQIIFGCPHMPIP